MKYETIIGFELHLELATKTKVFCGCATKFGSPANTQVCPVCLGMPGSLPVLNRRAFDYSLRAALALNCDISSVTTFERKNYYYPDLPKNYQISQLRRNLGENGWVDIDVAGKKKRIRINNIHLEEDAGKNVHPEGEADTSSLVDLNRAGTPLLEIVSEPDLRGPEDAMAYMQGMKNLLEYIDISDCNMHEGRLRFELNISQRRVGETGLPPFRSELKNIASMKTVIKCVEYETKRMCRALDKGEKLADETRLWNEERQRTETMRSKESANDYRYFPEPDLVDIEVDDAWIERVRGELPEMPEAKKARFVETFGLPEYDAEILTATRSMADYYERAVAAYDNPKGISNWMMTGLLRELNDRGLEASESPVAAEHLADLVKLIDEGTISGKIAKDVFAEMLAAADDADMPREPAKIVEAKGWVQVKDTGQVEQWVDEVIAANPGPAQDFTEGKDRAMGFLVGQIMKMSRGKANPQMVNDLITKKLRG